jgi:serine protease Do
MRRRILIATALIPTILGTSLPDRSCLASEARRTAGIVALAGDTAAAKNPLDQRSSQSPAACGWIGVPVSAVTPAFADSLGMTEPYGAIFGRPRPGSPAAKAKIEAGDVVTAVNGLPLRSWRDFAPIVAQMAPDTAVYLTTWRNRQLRNVRVMLGSGPCRR